MAPIRRVVLDLLKPHEPTSVELASHLADARGVEAVNAMLLESDREVQNIKITVEGDDVDFDALEAAVEDLGGSVHSIDEVVAGEYLLEAVDTHQD